MPNGKAVDCPGLPDGWECIEKSYLAGKHAGKTYQRFNSAKHKNVISLKQAIKLDATDRGIPEEEALQQFELRKKQGQAKEQKAESSVAAATAAPTRTATSDCGAWKAQCAGKVAVITGASRGLGAGMAREFQRMGLKLGLCSRSPPCLQGGGNVVSRQVDMEDGAAVEAFAAEVCKSFGGVFNGTKAFVQHVRAREGGGVLLNISSGAARKGYASWGAYCSGKGAVDRLTECVQMEEVSSGLRAYAVAPGIVDTGMQERIRGLTAEEFPSVSKFLKVKHDNAFNTPEYVAQQLLTIAFDPAAHPSAVACSIPAESPSS
eukprot:TRINITY_DN28180_c0_g1_i2.p1 TRINITY_DN28180_c0_g1~~TRINITY_DN28180_c0_g1_i2.p1  ORF type:complete len:319 (-),score=64.51 TRINITY_DN28180_c0_g1_i2:105-1061(-)